MGFIGKNGRTDHGRVVWPGVGAMGGGFEPRWEEHFVRRLGRARGIGAVPLTLKYIMSMPRGPESIPRLEFQWY
jgi:hypothetical protein